MNFLEHRFTLDVRRDASKVCVRVRKGDTARRLRIALVQGVVPYEIRSDCYAMFSAVKPDGNRLFNPCTIEDNRIVYELTPQTTAVIGLVECEVRLYGADDALITSPGFDLIVDEVLYDEDRVPQSETEVNALTGLISDAAEVIAEGRELIGDFGSALGQIEGVRDEAEAAAEAAVAAAESAKTTAGEVAKQVQVAADAAEVAGASADEAGEAAVAAVNAREAATTAAGNAAYSAEEAVAAAERAKNYVQSIPEGGTGVTDEIFHVTYNLVNVVCENCVATVKKGANFFAFLNAIDGYTIKTLKIVHNGETTTDSTYEDETTDAIGTVMGSDGVQGDIVVIAVAKPISGSSQNDDKIPTSADLNGTTATFRNSAGIALFTLDLSGLGGGSAAVYGNLVLSAEELTITEGQNGTFTVALDKAPTANQPVYLAVSDGSRLSVEPAVLTFTPEDWETPQTITVTSLEDDDEEDNAITVTLTSTAVDARQVAVAIKDNDVQLEIVTDGLVLNMDYTGHVGDESDTITDLASGVSFNAFGSFTKLETGVAGGATAKYLTAVNDDAKTNFVNKLKGTGAFTVEYFGTNLANPFFCPHYRAIIGTGSGTGWIPSQFAYQNMTSNATRILQDGTSEYGAVGGNLTYTISGSTKKMQLMAALFPYKDEFMHAVLTHSASGEVNIFLNGVKCDAPAVVENFKEWDFDTMFGGDWSLIRSYKLSDGFTTAQRIYNRVLTAEEVQQNMKANAKMIGLSTF